MDELDELQNKIKELKSSINVILQQTFASRENELKAINQGQLFNGEDSKGVGLRPFYALSTIKQKRRKGQPFDRVTLRDTGNYYRDIEIKAGPNSVEFTNSQVYSMFLEARYGKDILGIQEDNLETFLNRFFLPQLKNKYDTISKS